MSKPSRRTVLLVAVVMIAICTLIFIGRGWIRSKAVPAYSKLAYGTSVNKVFNREFPVLNNQLESSGFKIAAINDSFPNKIEPISNCSGVDYKGFQQTIFCRKDAIYRPNSFNNTLVNNWTDQSPKLIQLLEDNGWRKEYADQPSFKDLFNHPKDSGNWLTYVKDIGRMHCEFGVAYNPPYPNPADQVWASESCEREVKFFGGY